MSDIDKKLVYNAYENSQIWLTDTEDNFVKLYEQGYRYITHYDKTYDTVYSIDSEGGCDLLWEVKYSNLKERINDVDEFLAAINNPNKRVIWFQKEKYEIIKDDPIYTVFFTSVPSKTTLFNFYAEIIEKD